MAKTAHDCAREVLEAVPPVMRFIRQQMRSHLRPGVSVSQFRLLAFLGRHDAATPSAAAEHLGLSLPSLSRMFGSLVRQKLITRQVRAKDRRQVSLRLTAKGRRSLNRARREAQLRLAERMARFHPGDLAATQRSMAALRRAFDPAQN